MPKKILTGKVVSDKMDKTIVVEVESRKSHPRYKKIIKKTKRFKAHDEENKCKVGDLVEIIEHIPISKTKRWMIKEILVRSE